MIPADLLIAGGALVPMDDAGAFFADGAVAVGAGRVLAAGESRSVVANYAPAERIDASGMAILPGLVNGHGHAALSLLRGLAEDVPLQRWLTRTVWPIVQHAGEAETYAGARLACLEMIRSGITTFADMWRDVPATARAVEESGLRAVLAFNMRDFSDPSRLEPEWKAGLEALLARPPTGRVAYGLGPHSLYACSEPLLRRCAATLAERGCHLQIHVAETRLEVDDCVERFGRTPVERLDELGLLGPRTLIAHGVWLDPADRLRLAATGAAVTHNVSSNLKLASGVASLPELARAGVPLALGTDSAASNNVLDLFREMKTAALLQRATTLDPAAWPPAAVLRAATRGGARALGLEREIGSLEPGKRADVILVDLARPHLTPHHTRTAETLLPLLVFAATGRDVDTTIVDGHVLMRRRRVLSLDVDAVVAEAQAASARLLERTGAS